MRAQVGNPAPQRVHVRTVQLTLCNAAVVFQRPHRRNQHHAVRMQPRHAALDIHKLLRAKIRPEARLGDRVIGKLERNPRRLHAVAAMRDIRERPAVHQAGGALQRLDQVGLQSVLEQHRHRAVRVQVGRMDGRPAIGVSHKDAPQPRPQVVKIIRQAQDRHHLGGNGNHEMLFARHAVHLPAKPDGQVAQRTVIHIEHAREHHPPRVNAQRVTLLQMVVEHGAEQVVRRRNGVHVTGKMEIDVLHRHDLRIAAARSAALHAEHRPERRLPQRDDRPLPQLCHCLPEPHGRRRFALPGRRGVDRGHEDQLAVLPGGKVSLDSFA